MKLKIDLVILTSSHSWLIASLVKGVVYILFGSIRFADLLWKKDVSFDQGNRHVSEKTLSKKALLKKKALKKALSKRALSKKSALRKGAK